MQTSHSYFVGSATSRRWKYVTPAMRLEEGYIPEPNSGCWLWLGSGNQYGYGRMLINRKCLLAHRVSYEIHKGPIPDGLELDHLCRVRCCVNPAHLEPVTHAENVRRGAAVETHCKWGHPWDDKNTFMNGNSRFCRACNNARQKKTQAKKKLLSLEISI